MATVSGVISERRLKGLVDAIRSMLEGEHKLLREKLKFIELAQLGLFYFKRAESLGVDGGTGYYTVEHGCFEEGEPLYSALYIIGGIRSPEDMVYTYGVPVPTRFAGRPPWGEITTRQVFEARIRLMQLEDCALSFGLLLHGFIEPIFPSAHFFYDSNVSPNFQARSYNTDEEQTDTGVPADTAWHRFRIEITDSSVYFWIDNTLKAIHTRQIPPRGSTPDANMASITLVTHDGKGKAARYEYVAVWVE